MEGLEIAEVKLSDVLIATDYFRLEAEYYTAPSVQYKVLLKGRDVIADVQYGTSNYCSETMHGYPVLRLNEIDDCFITAPKKFCNTLSKEQFKQLRLNKNDVLVIRTNGNPDLVGQAAVVIENENIAFASYLYRVVPNERINSQTLVIYLNSKYGRYEINKNSMKGNQTNFSPEKLKDVNIPNFNTELQEAIAINVNQAYSDRKLANAIYLEAQDIVLTLMGIKNWQPKTEKVSVRKFSAVNSNNRFDAEYYQPKYDEIENKLLNDRSICNMPYSLKEQNYLPKNDKVYKYIELANIGANGEITGCTEALGSELPTRARRRVHCGDLIISSIEGSLQSCAYITEEYDNALCSTGFYVLSPKEINAETLLILFKSKTYQALLKKGCSGTILTAIAKNELEKIKLPIIPTETQNSIAEKVRQSFALRDESKRLLETAKRAVEIAIEEGEEKAVKYLEENK